MCTGWAEAALWPEPGPQVEGRKSRSWDCGHSGGPKTTTPVTVRGAQKKWRSEVHIHRLVPWAGATIAVTAVLNRPRRGVRLIPAPVPAAAAPEAAVAVAAAEVEEEVEVECMDKQSKEEEWMWM